MDYPIIVKQVKQAHGVCMDTDVKASLKKHIDKWTQFDFIARIICLVCLLEISMELSMGMQKVNKIPWKLVARQRVFHSRMRNLSETLRYESGFPKDDSPFLHASAARTLKSQATYPGARHEHLCKDEFMQVKLKLDRRDTRASGRANGQAMISLMHDMSDWCENVASFLGTRIDDIHTIIPTYHGEMHGPKAILQASWYLRFCARKI